MSIFIERHTQRLIISALESGGGFGGLLSAVRMIQNGFNVDNILIVEPVRPPWRRFRRHLVLVLPTRDSISLRALVLTSRRRNRYPGLMCDTESYIYLPLLEEMGYMPTRKYASGSEIRKYAESIATKYGLHSRAQFQSVVRTAHWQQATKEWKIVIVEKAKGESEVEMALCADYVVFASGVLSNAKLPQVDGFDVFEGHSFHTARWDYTYTGGSPEQPDLAKLNDKRVAYIGTGATAIQSVPKLAKWSKELYIVSHSCGKPQKCYAELPKFQRTPSAVDGRDNRDTDPARWKSEVATGEGWQRARSRNFHAFTSNAPEKPAVNMVDDEWTRM
ncbi:hypothetical protein LTR02_012396 [Friedmanniomyces endolithicus]|nr:hypothetical protein LTR02_012396 [Friedmanniomyces endolithicus]